MWTHHGCLHLLREGMGGNVPYQTCEGGDSLVMANPGWCGVLREAQFFGTNYVKKYVLKCEMGII